MTGAAPRARRTTLRAVVLSWLCCAGMASAQAADVPLLPNGKVDVDAVVSTFSATIPVYAKGEANRAQGTILGRPFAARWTQGAGQDGFDLTLSAEQLSEHGVFLATVMLNEIICIRRGQRPGGVRWHETSVRTDAGWTVRISCQTGP